MVVYKVESDQYLTPVELRESGEWQSFGIKDEDEFDHFHHGSSQPIEGRGVCLAQEISNKMLEFINKEIQKHRSNSSASPVHIAISESLGGMLRYSLERPKEVLGFPDFFAIGPVWRLNEEDGQSLRFNWMFEHINSELEDYEYENRFNNALLEIEDIPPDVPIYLWTANNASEQLGMRFILHELKEKANNIFVINSTNLYHQGITTNEGEQSFTSTHQLEPEDIRMISKKAKASKPLSIEEKLRFLSEWKELTSSKEVLWGWQNHHLVSLPEDYYDSLIIDSIEKLHRDQEEKDFIMAGEVIGEILNVGKQDISHGYLEYRLRELVYSGKLALKGIPKSMRHYSVKLRG